MKRTFFVIVCCVMTIYFLPVSSLKASYGGSISSFNEAFLTDQFVPKFIQLGGYFYYSSFDGYSAKNYGILGVLPYGNKWNFGASLGLASWSPDEGDSESGLANPHLFAGYKLFGENSFHLLGHISVPIGKEEAGDGNFSMGAGGRYHLAIGAAHDITAVAKFNVYETKEFDSWGKTDTKYKTGVYLHGLYEYGVNDNLEVYGRFIHDDQREYTLLAAGGFFHFLALHNLKAELGFGLSDGAPDFQVFFVYLPRL